MRRSAVICFLLSACLFPLLRCQAATDDSNRFIIMSAGGPCSGYYILNGGDPVTFSVDAASGSYYKFTKDLSSPESITISVSGSGSALTSVDVYVYSDNELVDSDSFSSSATSTYDTTTSSYTYAYTVSGLLSYTFTSSTTTSSSSE